MIALRQHGVAVSGFTFPARATNCAAPTTSLEAELACYRRITRADRAVDELGSDMSPGVRSATLCARDAEPGFSG